MKASTSTETQAVDTMADNSIAQDTAPSLRRETGEAAASRPSLSERRVALESVASDTVPPESNLHELANSLTAVLINIQVLEWKLPPYSHLKRAVREIERHALRSSALLKHLLGKLEAMEKVNLESCLQVLSSHYPAPTNMTAADQGLDKTNKRSARGPLLECNAQIELTSSCDGCTSARFPKEE
jgi:hypothetical protein